MWFLLGKKADGRKNIRIVTASGGQDDADACAEGSLCYRLKGRHWKGRLAGKNAMQVRREMRNAE